MITFTLTHYAYCGMHVPIIDTYDRAEREEARSRAARRLRSMRQQGYPVVTLERGRKWEVQEPEDCVLVPVECGILSLSAVKPKTFRCWNCGDDIEEGESCNCQEPVDEEETEEEE